MSSTAAAILGPSRHLELVAVEVARLAATFVRASQSNAQLAGTKSSATDVVTDVDLRSEELIRAELLSRCPGSSIVGEEFDEHAGANTVGWIVDPIDGTVNFLYGLPVVSVSIAATVDGVTVAGAVADVLTGVTYSAELGAGARREGERVGVAAPATLGDALIGTGFSYDAELRAEQAAVIGELLPRCRDIRCMGSAALNLCFVASGRLDAYFERDIKLYDYAAGALIAAEAGAVVRLPAAGPGHLTSAASPAISEALDALIVT